MDYWTVFVFFLVLHIFKGGVTVHLGDLYSISALSGEYDTVIIKSVKAKWIQLNAFYSLLLYFIADTDVCIPKNVSLSLLGTWGVSRGKYSTWLHLVLYISLLARPLTLYFLYTRVYTTYF